MLVGILQNISISVGHVNNTESMSNLQLSLPAQAFVLIVLTYSSILLYICSFCIHKISHTGLAVKIGTFFFPKKWPLFIWKHFGHNFSHFLGQILLKIYQPKVKKVDNPSQFGHPVYLTYLILEVNLFVWNCLTRVTN